MNNTYLTDHLVKKIDFLELYKQQPKSDFKLDEVKWEDIQEDIKKYGIRNHTVQAVRPDFVWAVNDLGTVEENIEAFEKMSKQDQGFFLTILEMTMAMEGIEFPREDTDLRRLYYSKQLEGK